MRFVGAIVAITLVSSSQAVAADMMNPLKPGVQPVEANGWSLSLFPYLWLAGISGDVAQFGSPTINIDRSFGDILNDLDVGGMMMGEARYGQVSIVGDLVYTQISTKRHTRHGIAARSVDVTSKTFTAFLGAGYSLVENQPLNLDIVGGARVWHVDTEIDIDGGLFNDFSAKDGATWVDAMAGLRFNYSITSELYLTGWSFVGAGGSDLGWDVAGAVGYKFNENFSMLAGYRSLGVDYNNDGYVFNIVQSGPILGFSARF